jgi:uncharacterized protein YjiS (DUF1127 family)
LRGLEVQIMGKQQRARRNRPLNAFLAALVHVVDHHVLGLVRRGPRRRSHNEELARLDERTLRDIGLTRAQVRAAAYGLVSLGGERGDTAAWPRKTSSASAHQPLAAGPHAVIGTPLSSVTRPDFRCNQIPALQKSS